MAADNQLPLPALLLYDQVPNCEPAVVGTPGSRTGTHPTSKETAGMAGWSAGSGTHNFVVPDRARADALAAAVVARDFGGYRRGGSRCDPDMLHQYQDGPIVHTNPGARPPVPDVVITPAPPKRALDLGPDSIVDGVIDPAGLDDVDWAQLTHAHGSAEDVPELIRALGQNSSEWDAVLDELFGDDLLHQGTCYSATAPALPFIGQLAAAGSLPAARRLELHLWLITAADYWAAGLLGDADRAAAQGRFPAAAQWTQDVHRVVGEQVPALLARWTIEPPAIQYILACLAALYPQSGQCVAENTAALAATSAGCQIGQYLQLAELLQRTDDRQALTIAQQIATWDEYLRPAWLDAPNVTAALKAAHALVRGATRTGSHPTR
ncbi:hypothetical protein [Amycolatopsis sp. DSM 110486]|uniref:hypothetical protein n=1 Tax=Amycolatopsis sp. DSM 110486 TaxID=2865832 RepID=UPI001C69DFC4|nr:hypothetical protein [Amycolatopsis sp. DSM 110486]QYN24176.1 hypothetical protein K1T34_18050 [Amycolatopsis sp. DSM 110486]